MTMQSVRAAAGGVERRQYPAKFELRSVPDGTGGERFSLEGYASAYDQPYEMLDWAGTYTESVRSGAGTKTLSENPDVVLVFNHGGVPMARTKANNLALSEDSTGLHMRATGLNPGISSVRDTVAGIEEGILDEMSFAFRIVRQEWNEDFTDRQITEFNLNRGDVSVVTFGANPMTSVALRAAMLDSADRTLDGDALVEAARRFAHRLQRAATPMPDDVRAMFAQVLGQVAAVDSIVDKLQEQIAANIGVPNPDSDDVAAERAAALIRTLRAQDDDLLLRSA